MSLALTGPATGSRLGPTDRRRHVFADLSLGARIVFRARHGGWRRSTACCRRGGLRRTGRFSWALLAGASVAALFRVDLPFSPQGATMSLSFAFTFAGLLLLGPDPTLLIASAAAWVQCTVNVSPRNPCTARLSAWPFWR